MTRGKETTSGGPGRLLALGVGLVLLVVGCDSGPKRCHVSGQVLYKGKPVPAGEVYFDPDFTKGHDGPQGFARIKDGRYDTREIGKPLAAGPHVVRVLGFDGKIPPGEDLPFGRRLFAEYKQSVDIPAQESATVDIDIPARGPGK